ncbi:MAG: methionyl-tRNA formyltransferase [Alphaproteobacteria bacterium]
MRLAFMGSPSFAVSALAALIAAGHEILAVYTQPPRPTGRGHKEQPSSVHVFAANHGLAVRTPRHLKDPQDQKAFSDLQLDAAIIVAYGIILPKPILEAPRYGCLNIHASLLPRWRGAAPIHAALLAGDPETGITIMQMDEGLDTGPILMQTRFSIAADETLGSLHDRLSSIGATAIVTALSELEKGRLHAISQPEVGASYAHKITKEDARLDWTLPAQVLARRIRAFAPTPGAFFDYGQERIKVLKAEELSQSIQESPGKILRGSPNRELCIACGVGGLRLLQLQRPGRQPLAAAEFLRGFPISSGVVLKMPSRKNIP